MTWMDQNLLAAGTSCVAVAAFADYRTRRIPNWLTGAGLSTAFLLHLLSRGWHDALASIAAGMVCGAVFMLPFIAGGMGAGDVKLIAAAGCFAGWPGMMSLLLWTVLAGGAMGLVLAVIRGKVRVTLQNTVALAEHHAHAGLTPHPELHVRNADTLRLPYGVAIACGFLFTLLQQTVVG